jgi:acetyltransferase
MLWIGGCTDDANFRARDLISEGVAVYRDSTPCTRAIRASYEFGQHVAARKTGALTPARPGGIDQAAAARRLQSAGQKLTEREAKAVLACYGLPVTQEALATNVDEAVSHAAKIGGKVVLKIDSPDIAHKTEAGGVRLGVEGKAAIAEAFDAILRAAKAYAPDARINGVLVQEMAKPGVELMLGVIRDPVFGPVVAVGLGGIFVEVLKDIAYRAAPVTPSQANEMLDELRGKKLLGGVRGMAPRDREAVVDAIVRLSWFAADFREDVAELDLNPLMVHEKGAGLRVLDALIIRNGAGR